MVMWKKSAAIAETRLRLRIYVSSMRRLLLSWSFYSRNFRRKARITASKSSQSQSFRLIQVFSIWQRYLSNKASRSRRIWRIAMGRSARLRVEYFLDWKYSCNQTKSAKSMCTAAVARFLSRVIAVMLRSVRYKKRLKAKAKLSVERMKGASAANVFSHWLALSVTTKRLRRACLSVSRRTWTQAFGLLMARKRRNH